MFNILDNLEIGTALSNVKKAASGTKTTIKPESFLNYEFFQSTTNKPEVEKKVIKPPVLKENSNEDNLKSHQKATTFTLIFSILFFLIAIGFLVLTIISLKKILPIEYSNGLVILNIILFMMFGKNYLMFLVIFFAFKNYRLTKNIV